MEIPALLNSPSTPFPDPKLALKDPNGLLAIGGELTHARLFEAYSNGIFPWYSDDQPILWWSPDPRAILYPDKIKISRSLHKILMKPDYQVSFDRAFADVISQCARNRRNQDGTWITPEMEQAYLNCHQQQLAHSLEIWQQDELIGGLYGICIGRTFFGESMFNRKPNAAKIALVYLTKQLQAWDFPWIDCQLPNAFLLAMGAETIPRENYLQLLAKSTALASPTLPWEITYDYRSQS